MDGPATTWRDLRATAHIVGGGAYPASPERPSADWPAARRSVAEPWDYLVVTASNRRQAAAYEAQLELRRRLGLLHGVGTVLVVPDPEGRRVGSGGSTILCLLEVLNHELRGRGGAPAYPLHWRRLLAGRSVLIVHGGGDSRRLPAYGPCGKIFVPVPGDSDRALPDSLFDRLLPVYLALPSAGPGRGQVVVTAGDVLVSFNPGDVRFEADGVTGLGCLAPPDEASRHGVYCPDDEGRVRRFLQKPSLDEQAACGAISRQGESILDIGVVSLDAATAVVLLTTCGAAPDRDGRVVWSGPVAEAIAAGGLDFYTEICCAMGTEATAGEYAAAARAAGSALDEACLGRIFDALSPIAFRVQVLPRCRFLHFGTTRQLITSGAHLARSARGVGHPDPWVGLNNEVAARGEVAGSQAWVEGCRIRSTLRLDGENVVVGADIDEPLHLPGGACLDVLAGRTRDARPAWFVRCYHAADRFKETAGCAATFCNRPLDEWLAAVGARPDDVWPRELPPEERTVWNARLFPTAEGPGGFRPWLWMFAPEKASAAERCAWRRADRYSLAEIAALADQGAFHERRARICAKGIRGLFHRRDGLAAADLAWLLAQAADPAAWVAELLAEAQWQAHRGVCARRPGFVASRLLHSLGSALETLAPDGAGRLCDLLPGLCEALAAPTSGLRAWLAAHGLAVGARTAVGQWATRARGAAFHILGEAIIGGAQRSEGRPRSVVRADEIVWGRAPARLDLGGGWTDTPPYALEHGGAVLNAAVDLNGQPPIQAHARVVREPVIRITSIDLGLRLEIAELDELLDYRSPHSEFALAKAALALSGLSPHAASWPADATLEAILADFGGGIELSTLAAVPRGSGLGTSSIMGAVILAVVQRLMGRRPTPRQLFHDVLRLEQALTTGGGWQDQIGGAVDGAKIITTRPGLVPDPQIHHVPADVLDPTVNGGQTLLYYTGITRLAKDILQQVVGRYLDRDRAALATLGELHRIPGRVAAAMGSRDLPAFGRLIDVVWRLNKQLDPGSTSPEVEALLARVEPYAYGAKLLGAGGGGFLLVVSRSPEHAARLREALEAEPPNDRARFFDFAVSRQGLAVTVC